MTILPRKVYNKWWVLIAVAMGVFLATIDGSIVNIGLNTLVEDMQKPLAVVEWVVLAYMLTLSTLLLSIGRLSDIVGKKKLFLAGMILFTISSGLCGLAGSVFWLIGFRVLQAVGGSMIMAIGTAIVTEAFPPQERGKALGIMGTMVSIGIIAGPTIGGLLLQSLTWHWLFFVNLPIGFIGVFMVLRFVPESTPGDKQKFDFAGAGLLFVSMASFLFALTTGQHGGFDNLKVIGMFVLSVSALSLFIGIERRTTQPMIDLTMFRNAQFSINLITGVYLHSRDNAYLPALSPKHPSIRSAANRSDAGDHASDRCICSSPLRSAFRPGRFTPHHHPGIVDVGNRLSARKHPHCYNHNHWVLDPFHSYWYRDRFVPISQ
jgi:EmrB/QacA subfamily drug resistance transporter